MPLRIPLRDLLISLGLTALLLAVGWLTGVWLVVLALPGVFVLGGRGGAAGGSLPGWLAAGLLFLPALLIVLVTGVLASRPEGADYDPLLGPVAGLLAAAGLLLIGFAGCVWLAWRWFQARRAQAEAKAEAALRSVVGPPVPPGDGSREGDDADDG